MALSSSQIPLWTEGETDLEKEELQIRGIAKSVRPTATSSCAGCAERVNCWLSLNV
jgi:hypothetical protein